MIYLFICFWFLLPVVIILSGLYSFRAAKAKLTSSESLYTKIIVPNTSGSDSLNAVSAQVDMDVALERITQAARFEETSDKRKYPRQQSDFAADLVIAGRLVKSTMKNLSYGGIFLKTAVPASCHQNDVITVAFQLPTGQAMKYNGRIVRTDTRGMGVQFIR